MPNLKKYFHYSVLLIAILTSTHEKATAQKYDYHWILGEQGVPSETGNMDVIFTDTSADTLRYQRGVEMDNGQTTISDSAGNLLFFTNGCRILNRNNAIMQNGDSLNYGPAWDQYFNGFSYNTLEEIIGLPTDTLAIWNLIHYYIQYIPNVSNGFYVWEVLESRIDMRRDTGLGGVLFKNKTLVQDTLGSYVTACQHANGRDWWVLASKTSSNCLYTMLVQPDTVIQYPMQCLGGSYISGDAGQAAFSPDGTKFAWIGGYSGINIYDFDRCTGLLSNPTFLNYYGLITSEYGLSFSPNSRFLYATQSSYVLQFDLYDSNVNASVDTIAIITLPPDSNEAPYGYYFLMQLAPDGKIYISANNSEKYLHVINNPDQKGDSCGFVNYGFRLPVWNSFGIPSYPGNYRLGPLTGSPCDTLKTAITEAKTTNEKILKIYPNPATDYAVIDYGFTDWSMGTSVSMEIADAIGKVIYTQPLPMYSGFQKLDLTKFAAGIYTVAIKRNSATVAVAKLVKQ